MPVLGSQPASARSAARGYLPSRHAAPPFGWDQIILLGDRGTCVETSCKRLNSAPRRSGFEPETCW